MHAGIEREREGDRLREKMGGMMAFYYAIILCVCMIYNVHVQGLIQEFSAGGGPGCVQFVHAMMSLHTIYCENSVSRIGA